MTVAEKQQFMHMSYAGKLAMVKIWLKAYSVPFIPNSYYNELEDKLEMAKSVSSEIKQQMNNEKSN